MARDGAHIEDVFMDIAGDFVDKLERRENLPSQVANEIYKAIESNLDALLRDFKRSDFIREEEISLLKMLEIISSK